MESWIRDDNYQDGSISSQTEQVNCKENHEENWLQYLDVCHSQEEKFSDGGLIQHHLKDKTIMKCYLLCASLVAQRVRIHLQCGRPGFDPWVGKIPWRREQLPTPVFCPGEFKEPDMTEPLSLSSEPKASC